jgi:hypothetical protein
VVRGVLLRHGSRAVPDSQRSAALRHEARVEVARDAHAHRAEPYEGHRLRQLRLRVRHLSLRGQSAQQPSGGQQLLLQRSPASRQQSPSHDEERAKNTPREDAHMFVRLDSAVLIYIPVSKFLIHCIFSFFALRTAAARVKTAANCQREVSRGAQPPCRRRRRVACNAS